MGSRCWGRGLGGAAGSVLFPLSVGFEHHLLDRVHEPLAPPCWALPLLDSGGFGCSPHDKVQRGSGTEMSPLVDIPPPSICKKSLPFHQN